MLIVKANCFSVSPRNTLTLPFSLRIGTAPAVDWIGGCLEFNAFGPDILDSSSVSLKTLEEYTVDESLRKNPVYSSLSTNMDVPEIWR